MLNLTKKNIPLLFSLFLISACNDSPKNSNDSTSNTCEKACCENSRTKHLLKETLDKPNVSAIDSLPCRQDSTMKMTYIPGGEYYMGASNPKMALKRELPQHQVRVNAFYMLSLIHI